MRLAEAIYNPSSVIFVDAQLKIFKLGKIFSWNIFFSVILVILVLSKYNDWIYSKIKLFSYKWINN